MGTHIVDYNMKAQGHNYHCVELQIQMYTFIVMTIISLLCTWWCWNTETYTERVMHLVKSRNRKWNEANIKNAAST